MLTPAFYQRVTASLFKGSLPDWQREPLDRIAAVGEGRNKGLRKTAYVLATAYHETGRFRWMEEIGGGAAREYGETVPVSRGKRAGYWGRGFVQLTWLANYAAMSQRLRMDLVSDPDVVKRPEVAAEIIWEGMLGGVFGHRLSDHIARGRCDFVGARRCVNGTDQAELIAGYAEEFLEALRLR